MPRTTEKINESVVHGDVTQTKKLSVDYLLSAVPTVPTKAAAATLTAMTLDGAAASQKVLATTGKATTTLSEGDEGDSTS